MKKTIYTLLAVCLVSLFACQKDPYPYITLDEAKKIDSLVHPAIKNVAFIYEGNVYYVADFTKPVVQITKDGSAGGPVKLSHDGTKFAYLTAPNNIRIVDNKGAVLTTLSQYSDVKSFDWSADDKTLWILNGDDIAFYGPNMKLPGISYESFRKYSEQEILSASVSINGDLAYIIKAFDFFTGVQYELIIERADKGPAIEYRPDGFSGKPDYVSFSAHNQDLVVGYIDVNSYFSNGPQQNLEYFTDLNSYPAGHFGTVLTPTPVYNSKLNYIVAAGQNKGGTRVPAAFYLGTGETTVFTGANVAQNLFLDKFGFSGVLYIDWK